jgi:hypothetical protein
MELTESRKTWLIETAKALKGSDRRLFMARTVKELGRGGQRLAERELGWDRETIRKGTRELESGVVCLDAFSARGRKRADEQPSSRAEGSLHKQYPFRRSQHAPLSLWKRQPVLQHLVKLVVCSA